MSSTKELLSEIRSHKEALSRKNKELTDSIQYAHHIQSAILPTESSVKKYFPSSFVIFKPKDTVSGDFFWIKRKANLVIFAAADCTGHGVPGAFMSILGISFLNEIIARETLPKANRILNFMREAVMKALNQRGEEKEQRDGIDMALCVLDLETHFLQYAGANNNLYLLRNNKLTEFKGDRMPIGIDGSIEKPFAQVEEKLLDGDRLYLFSDGFPDQFGGPEGKKYKYPQFRSLIKNTGKMNINKQKLLLEKELDNWKGGNEQIDDILILGIEYQHDNCL